MLKGSLSFAQISDSHIGFNKAANPDVAGNASKGDGKINALSAAGIVRAAHRATSAICRSRKNSTRWSDH